MVALTDKEILNLQDALNNAEEMVTGHLFRVTLTKEQINAIIEALEEIDADGPHSG